MAHRHVLYVSLAIALCFAGQARPVAAQSMAPQGGATTPATPPGPIRIGPLTIAGSFWFDGQAVMDKDGASTSDSFTIRRARLGLLANLAPAVSFNVSAELTAQPALRNAFVIVALADGHALRFGQFTPMTAIERTTSVIQVPLIDRSFVTNQLTGSYDLGVSLYSTRPAYGWLGYAVNVMNGAGLNRSDDNDDKDISGRIALTPPELAALQFVVSGATGQQPTGERHRWSVGAEYRTAAWQALAERLYQKRGPISESDGYIAMAAYRLRPAAARTNFAMLELVGRWSALREHVFVAADGNPDEESSATVRELQAGANYYITPSVRLMGNLILPIDDRRQPGLGGSFRLQLIF